MYRLKGDFLLGEKGSVVMAENIVGRVINNQFRVDSYVPSQARDPVYKVWDLRDNKPLLMRILPDFTDDDPSAFGQIVHQANRLSRLNHPNIIPFRGLYKSQGFSFTLENFIDGITVDQLVKQQKEGFLPLRDALTIMKGVSDALAYAHSFGVVHADVKPANILVSQQGKIYLTGFKVDSLFVNPTQLPAPDAMPNIALETGRGKSAAPTLDVYAEGMLLFGLLTGQQLRNGPVGVYENAGQGLAERIQRAQLAIPQPGLPYSISDISADLAAVIQKSLEVNPADRYQNVKDFFIALCKAARLFVNEIPGQLEAEEVPVTGAQPITNFFNRETLNGCIDQADVKTLVPKDRCQDC